MIFVDAATAAFGAGTADPAFEDAFAAFAVAAHVFEQNGWVMFWSTNFGRW